MSDKHKMRKEGRDSNNPSYEETKEVENETELPEDNELAEENVENGFSGEA